MSLASSEGLRISRRLKDALVADLVMEDLGEQGDRWLVLPLRDEHEWTEHFARQLGMQATYESGGIHDTLLVIIGQVDEVIRTWPPRQDIRVCRELTHEATKHLTPIELLATLLAGPPNWRRMKIETGCTVERLASHLQPMLEKLLAAELKRVLGQWVQWDVPKLRERRKEALNAAQSARAKPEPEAAGPRIPYKRPSGRERTDRLKPLYQPPGRT